MKKKVTFSKYHNEVIIISLIFIILISKWGVLGYPFFWDELGGYVEYLNRLDNDFLYLFEAGGFLGHPPGLHLVLLPIYKLFNGSIFSIRLFCLLQTLVSVLTLYRLGCYLGGTLIGFVSAISFFLLPMVYAQSTMFLGDINFTAFSLLYILLYVKDRNRYAIVMGLLLGGMRETAVLVGSAVLVSELFKNRFTFKFSKGFVVGIAPFITLGLFFLYNWTQVGEFTTHKAYADGDFGWNFLAGLQESAQMLFAREFMYLFSIPTLIYGVLVVACSLFIKEKGTHFVKPTFLVLSTFLATIFIIFCAANKGRLTRYFLPVYPLLVIWGTYSLRVFLRHFFYPAFLAIIVVLINNHSYSNPKSMGTAFDNEMQYVDVIKVSQKAMAYIEKKYSDRRVFSSWPIYHKLQFPYMGYVGKKIDVVFPISNNSRLVPQSDYDIFVWSNNSDVTKIKDKDRFIAEEGLQMVKRFEENGKVIEIYIVPD